MNVWKRLFPDRPKDIDADKVDMELSGVRFGLRCLMVQGGFKVRKGIKDLDNEQILARADATVTLIMNVFMFVRAAEDVIVRHGLVDEYKAQCAKLQNAIEKMMPQPNEAELVKLREALGMMAKGAADGQGESAGVRLSEAGGDGDGTVDQVGVRGDQPESTE